MTIWKRIWQHINQFRQANDKCSTELACYCFGHASLPYDNQLPTAATSVFLYQNDRVHSAGMSNKKRLFGMCGRCRHLCSTKNKPYTHNTAPSPSPPMTDHHRTSFIPIHLHLSIHLLLFTCLCDGGDKVICLFRKCFIMFMKIGKFSAAMEWDCEEHKGDVVLLYARVVVHKGENNMNETRGGVPDVGFLFSRLLVSDEPLRYFIYL